MRLLTLRNVLVASDLTSATDTAVDSAQRLARAAGATLHAVHVLPASEGDAAGASRAAAIARAKSGLRAMGLEDGVQLHIVDGPPPKAIRSVADRVSADVIVLGPPKNLGWQGGPMGGTAYAVASRAFAPCLVVARPLRLPLERILVPIDLSDTARGALLAALSWGSALRGRGSDRQTSLVALHSRSKEATAPAGLEDDESLAREMDAIRRHAGAWAGVSVRVVVTSADDVVGSIVDRAEADEPDLLVLGTRGLGLDVVDKVGSVSVGVLSRLSAPTLLVPPAVWRAFGSEMQSRAPVEPRAQP